MLHSSAQSALSAGEYSHESTQSISTKKTPMSPADLADNADKPQNYKTTITTPPQTVFLCEIMQLAAFPLRNQRNLRENNTQEYSINIHRRNPSISRRFTQTKPKTTLISPNCLSLRNNAACCIPLRDLRHLRENNHTRVLKLSQGNHNVSR